MTALRLARVASLVLVAMLAGACVHARNFQDPRERITRHTAYAEQARIRLDADLLATEPQRFVVNAGLTVAAVPRHLDFSVNLAHGAIGVVNVQSKFTLLDTRFYGLGGRVGLTYLNPRTFYFLPRELRRELGSFHIASVPIELWQSFPINQWFGADLGFGYRVTGLWGEYSGDELLVDASLAQRWLAFMPFLSFYIARRVALRVGARLPVFTQVVAANDVQVELSSGVLVGVRSVEWVARPFSRTVQAEFGAETRFGRNTYLRLGVSFWAFRPLDRLAVMPTLNLYWRFR